MASTPTLSVAEAARATGLSERELERLAAARLLAVVREGGEWRISPEALVRAGLDPDGPRTNGHEAPWGEGGADAEDVRAELAGQRRLVSLAAGRIRDAKREAAALRSELDGERAYRRELEAQREAALVLVRRAEAARRRAERERDDARRRLAAAGRGGPLAAARRALGAARALAGRARDGTGERLPALRRLGRAARRNRMAVGALAAAGLVGFVLLAASGALLAPLWFLGVGLMALLLASLALSRS
jgi:excisionase family DNA binding protein